MPTMSKCESITKTSLFKYTENFTTKKKNQKKKNQKTKNRRKFSGKNSSIFHITSQDMDCGTR